MKKAVTLYQIDDVMEVRIEQVMPWPEAMSEIEAYIVAADTFHQIQELETALKGIYFTMPGSFLVQVTGRFLGVGTGVGGALQMGGKVQSLWVPECAELAKLILHITDRLTVDTATAETKKYVEQTAAGRRVKERLKNWPAEAIADLNTAAEGERSWQIATRSD